ncbi:MAG: molybdate ABC transporter permease subunit [Cyclobacteriaceae bacterium]
MNWSPLILTFQLAIISTLVLLLIGIPIASGLAHANKKFKPFLEAIVSLPLVLPPTVIGFYLLIAFSPNSILGRAVASIFGIQLAFSFTGLVIGSVIYSLPFMVQPIHSGLISLGSSLKEASLILGKSRWQTLINVTLPNIKPALLSGIILSFAHTIGEFGIVLMIGGNIPDQTRVASIAIYDHVEALNYGEAHTLSIILISITFITLVATYLINGQFLKRTGA